MMRVAPALLLRERAEEVFGQLAGRPRTNMLCEVAT